jgi:hypothetical protein
MWCMHTIRQEAGALCYYDTRTLTEPNSGSMQSTQRDALLLQLLLRPRSTCQTPSSRLCCCL